MEIRRTPRQTAFAAATAAVAAGLALWNIRDGLRTDSTALLVLGGVFAVWTAYLALDLLRRRVPILTDAAGVTIHHALRSIHVPYGAMTWATIGGGRRAGIIAYRRPGDDKEQYAVFAQRTVGEEGVMDLKEAIRAARPDLPESRQDDKAEGSRGKT